MKDNTEDQETHYEYEVKTPPPTNHPNTPSKNHDYVNSTPENQNKSEIRNNKNAVRQTKYLSLFTHKYNGHRSSRKMNNSSRHYTNETN